MRPDIREQSLPRRTKTGVLAIGEGSLYGHWRLQVLHQHAAARSGHRNGLRVTYFGVDPGGKRPIVN